MIGVNGYVSILIAYFVLRYSTGESINAVALLTNVMPVCLLPCFLFLPFTLWRRHIVSSLGNLLICIIFGVYWGSMFTHSTINGQGRAPAELSILSHNMAQDQTDYDSIDALVERTDADIVLLQEVTGDYIKDHWPRLRTRYPYQVNGPLLSAKSVGMGILSKYPLDDVTNFKLDEDGLVFQQRAEVSLDGKRIAVYNVHTTFPWVRLERDPWLSRIPWPVYDDKTRRKEITNLLRQLQSETAPLILAGDFNLSDFSEDYGRLTSVLGDAYRSAGSGLGFTWPANRTPSVSIPIHHPLVRIDYIFHSDQWQPKYAHTLEKTGSDHLPLFTSLDLRDDS
jgi:vancomycin resistance protein VanJ